MRISQPAMLVYWRVIFFKGIETQPPLYRGWTLCRCCFSILWSRRWGGEKRPVKNDRVYSTSHGFIRLMEEIRLTSWYGKYPIIYRVFTHLRWCRISSINRMYRPPGSFCSLWCCWIGRFFWAPKSEGLFDCRNCLELGEIPMKFFSALEIWCIDLVDFGCMNVCLRQ